MRPAFAQPSPAAPPASTSDLYEDTDEAPASPAPTPSPSAAPDAPTGVAALAVPKSDDDAANVLAAIDARLAELRGAGRPDTEGPPSADPLADAVSALQDTIQAARQQVETLRAELRKIVELSSPEHLADRSSRLEGYAKRAAELDRERTEGLYFYWDAQLEAEQKAIAEEYDKFAGQADAMAKQQTARQAALAQIPQRQQEATEALAAARTALDAMQKGPVSPAPSATPSPLDAASRERQRTLEIERQNWLVYQAALRGGQVVAEQRTLELQMSAAETTLPALQSLTRALGQYRTKVDAMAAESESKRIEDELARVTRPEDKAYWRLRLLVVKTRQDFASRRGDIRKRFKERDRQSFIREIQANRLFYDRLRDRLERTTGEEKITSYRRLEDLIARYERRLAQLNRDLDVSRRELDDLHSDEDAAADQLDAAREELRTAIEQIRDPEARQQFDRLITELATQHRPQLDAAIAEVTSTQTELVNRQEATAKELAGLIKELGVHREKLFWSYTLARGPRLDTAAIDSVRDVRSGVVATNLRACQIEDGGAFRLALRKRGLLACVVVVLSLVVTFAFRRRFTALAERREARINEEAAGKDNPEIRLTDRAWVQMTRFVAGVLPVGLPFASVLAFTYSDSALPPRVGALARSWLVLGLLLVVSWVAIDRLFESGKARYRLLQCSNVVAGHYRFWLRTLWVWHLVLLPVYLAVSRLRLGISLLQLVDGLYLTGGIVIVILFALDRQTVLRVVGRPFAARHPLALAAVARTYLLQVLVLVAMLVLVVAGYGAFVTYALRGMLQSIAAVIAAALLSQLLKEFARKHGAVTVSPKEDEAAHQETHEQDLDEVLRVTETREWGLLLGGAVTLSLAAIWGLALVWIGAAWGMTAITAQQMLAYEVTARGAEAPVTVGRILIGLLIFIASFRVSRILRAFLDSQIYPAYANFNRGARATVNTLLHYTLVLLGLYFALHMLNLNFGALAVLLGGLGLGLGLGLQPLVVNFFSGLVIFAERHVKVGDVVKVGEELGEVAGISMRSTRVRLFDGVDLIIPNSEFVNSRVTNWTHRDTKIRGDIRVRVAYGSDVRKVGDLLLNIANRNARVMAYPEPAVTFEDFGESALAFVLACWFPTPADRGVAMNLLRYEIESRFRDEGIVMPYPQRTLTIDAHSAGLPIQLAPRQTAATDGDGNGQADGTAKAGQTPPETSLTAKPAQPPTGINKS